MAMDAGLYAGRPIKGTMAEAKSSGNPQMVVEFQVTHIKQDKQWVAIPEPLPMRRLYLTFTDAAMPYTAAKLKLLGFNGDMDEPKFILDGKGVRFVCSHKEDGGETKERWDVDGVTGPEIKKSQSAADRAKAMWKSIDLAPASEETPF